MNINKDLFGKVKGLNLPTGEYALFGSAPLGIRELKKCRDIDIIMSENLWNEYKNKLNWKIKKNLDRNDSYCLCNDDNDIELWKDWAPGAWNVVELIKEAEIIDDLPFVKLEQVIKWKKLNGRGKDLKDIEIIEIYLKSEI
jgi:hypothetical protein